MSFAQKMFSRATKACPIRSDCKSETDRRYFDRLFEKDWEVFVVKRRADRDTFDWFTLCCDAATRTTNVG